MVSVESETSSGSSKAVPVSLQVGDRLSPMQRPLWVSQLNDPQDPAQNMPQLTTIEGPVDPELLAEAFASVVARADVLRTTLSDSGDRQWRVSTPSVTELPATEIVAVPTAELDHWANARAVEPLDLGVSGYDSAIAVHEDGTASWYLNLHHVITDATTSGLVFDATSAAYRLLTGGDAPEDEPFPSYYRWAAKVTADVEASEGRGTTKALKHWKQRTPPPRIGRLYRAPGRPTTSAARRPVTVDDRLADLIDQRLQAEYRLLTPDLSWTVLLTTATALYCHRISGVDRFAIGLPVHQRGAKATRDLIGPTMEVFPVDIEILADDTGLSLYRRVTESVLETLGRAVPGTAPAADVEVVVNIVTGAGRHEFGGLPSHTRWIHPEAIDAGHLLRVQLNHLVDGSTGGGSGDTNAGPGLVMDLNRGAADPDHIERAPDHLLNALAALVTDPNEPIGDSSLCTDDEVETIKAWEQGESPAPPGPNHLPQRLAGALAGNPAIVIEGPASVGMTGDELWQRVVAVADRLRADGVEPGDRVAVELARSVEAVIAIMAVTVVGGSFVPLDPSQPASRRRRLRERAGCVTTIDDRTTVGTAPSTSATAVSTGLTPVELSADDEAYVLFTSGSTGEPKGVPITHGGLAAYLAFAEASYTVSGPPVAPLFSPLTFDLTVTSLFMPILAGGRLVVIESDGPAGLSAIAANPELTWCKATPSHLEILVRLLPEGHGLRTLVVGGEAFGTGLAARLEAAAPGLAIYNEYGPTEAVVGCMIHRWAAAGSVGPQDDTKPEIPASADDSAVPIGVPAPGVTLRVVDRHLQRVPIGSPGELLIAHAGLTPGYLGEADKTGGPFVELDGIRFYRSGDLVRLVDPETLIYLGRIDEQIKVGGIRLEPVEVEERLAAHPAVEKCAVRLWSPDQGGPRHHCVRCGLPDNVPGVAFDDEGVCATCHDYARVAPITRSWFKSRTDLEERLAGARRARTGAYDCLHLLSGGKDSTYALYQLVELGFRPYAFTLDNGFISQEALANVKRSVADLGVDHEFATSEVMNDVFRDSLQRHSNVCHGCYKTIYTLATTRAAELGIPVIVTGLSRGQLFETRLVPQQFDRDRFDPAAIDRAVLQARRIYHSVDDGPNRLLDTSVFDDGTVFDRVEYLDFYRYWDVELAEMLDFLDRRAPWIRPSDTGRSTNCLINAAGIQTHLTEQGYHNYAVPYAWDVRLGHKTRDEAIDELDDLLDPAEIGAMLDTVGYRPSARQVLTAWIEPTEGVAVPAPAEFRSFLAQSLPGHAIPAAFVEVDGLPLSSNGKLDPAALPAPRRVHRSGPALTLADDRNNSAGPERALVETGPGERPGRVERLIIERWERVLGIEPIGPDDDFFALGGDSLAALESVVAISETLDRSIAEDLAFVNTTPRQLARAIEADDARRTGVDSDPTAFATPQGDPPPRSDGELAVLFDQSLRPDDVMYNVARVFRVQGSFDAPTFEQALRRVTARHQPLSWSHAAERALLASERAVSVEVRSDAVTEVDLVESVRAAHRTPFDLVDGPLLRCVIQPVTDGTTAVVLVIHHASGDAAGFEVLWRQIDDEVTGTATEIAEFDYAGFCAWQAARSPDEARAHWLAAAGEGSVASLAIHGPGQPEPDGLITIQSSLPAGSPRGTGGASTAASALAALATVIRDHGDGSSVELGLITSTRDHPNADPLVGYLLNTVPVRINCGDRRPDELAGEAGAAIGGALRHRWYPAARIASDRAEAGLPQPTMEVLFAYDELGHLELAGQPVTQQVLSNGCAVAPLTFFVEARPDRVDLSVEYRGSVVSEADARRLLRRFDSALVEAVTGERPVESARDEQALLSGPPMATEAPLLPVLIGDHLAAGGDEPAAICGDDTITWSQLAERSAAVAGALVDAGVTAGDRVLVCLPRSTDLVAAIVGVHRAGCAYVPIDIGYPPARMATMATGSGATVGLVTAANADLVERPVLIDRLVDGAADTGPGTITDSTTTDSTTTDSTTTDSTTTGRPVAADPAYVIFTSGSTGEPSGVEVSHGNLAWSTAARQGVYDTAPSRFLMVSSPAFDSSIVGLFWTLSTGGTVVLPTDDESRDVRALAQLAGGASHLLTVPSLYRAMLTAAEADGLTGDWVEHVIVAGEACPPALVEAHIRAVPTVALTNEYGPTEASVWATAHRCHPSGKPIEGPVPIGRPAPGAWVAVVDSMDRVRPTGVEGQLVIGGPGVVEGYLDEPDRTERRFGRWSTGPSGTSVDRRFFRTGDRAVITEGTVKFLGRVDDQLNVGGVRAEPEDVERVLAADDQVVDVVVVAADVRPLAQLLDELPASTVGLAMKIAAEADDPAEALRPALITAAEQAGAKAPQLIAHVQAAEGHDETIIAERLRQRAADGLPGGLRPSRYAFHPALPVTPNGKLDRRAAANLAVPAVETRSAVRSTDGGRPLQSTASIDQLEELFARSLKTDDFGPDDDFFDHGGHSLLAMELLLSVEERFGTRLAATALYDAPTPRRLADLIRPQVDGSIEQRRPARRSFLVPIQPSGLRPPIFAVHVLGIDCAYFRPLADRLGPDQPMFGLGQPTADLDVDGPSDVADIAAAYAREIADTAPSGPICLAAISLGGVVAYELAQQLTEAGRDVALLALFDAYGPEATAATIQLSDKLVGHLRRAGQDPRRYAAEQLDHQRQRVQRNRERVALKVRQRLGLRSDHRLEVRRFIEKNVASQTAYRYQPYAGPVLIVKAGDDPLASEHVANRMGWGSTAVGRLTVDEAPGNHLSMMAEPNVGRVAELMTDALATSDDTTVTERYLAAALLAGTLTSAVGRLGASDSRPDSASVFDLELIDAVDSVLTTASAVAEQAAVEAASALDQAGLSAEPGPVPDRMNHPLAIIRLHRQSPTGPSSMEAATKALAPLGYRPVSGDGVARLDLVVDSGAGQRLRLVSDGSPVEEATSDSGSGPGDDLGIFLGTPPGLIQPILEFADLGQDDMLVDLGCGDGRVLIEAARSIGCRGRGYETDPGLAARARSAAAEAGVDHLIEILESDARAAQVHDADVVFAFLPPQSVAELVVSMVDRLPSGARFVSHEQLGSDQPRRPDRWAFVAGRGDRSGEGGITIVNLWSSGANG